MHSDFRLSVLNSVIPHYRLYLELTYAQKGKLTFLKISTPALGPYLCAAGILRL